jgi:hypothetical protein
MTRGELIERGQGLTEYLLCVSVLAIVLLLPAGTEASVAAQLAGSFRSFFRACSYLLSLS